jgi:hypothetical protein
MDRHAEFGHVRSSNSERIGIPALSALCIATTLRPFRATDVRADPHLLRQCRQTVLIMNSLNLSFSSVFGRCAERSNQTSCFRGAFNASKYFAESTEGTS